MIAYLLVFARAAALWRSMRALFGCAVHRSCLRLCNFYIDLTATKFFLIQILGCLFSFFWSFKRDKAISKRSATSRNDTGFFSSIAKLVSGDSIALNDATQN